MTSIHSDRTIAEVVAAFPSNPVVDAQKHAYVDGFRLSVGVAALVFLAAGAVALAIPAPGAGRSVVE